MKKQVPITLVVMALLLTMSCNVLAGRGQSSETEEVAAEKGTATQVLPPTNTAAPPTATRVPPTNTPLPPTDTPEPEAISAAEPTITIDEFGFRIAEVAYDSTAVGMAPSSMGSGDQIVWVEFKLLSGDQAAFEELQIKLADGGNRSAEAIILASNGRMRMLETLTLTATKVKHLPDAQNIAWAYVFPKSAGELYLFFPSGEKVDLTPVLP